MNQYKSIIAVFVMAIVTYIIRALPLTFFRKKIKSPWLISFLFYVPYAVLGAMVFPAILYSTQSMKTATIGFAVAIILALLEKDLLIVAIGGIIAVYVASCFGL